MESSWFVYIILCSDHSLYTGITNDVNRRFREHAQGLGAKYTRSRGVERVVYTENCHTRRQAAIREAQIKKLSPQEKRHLINTYI